MSAANSSSYVLFLSAWYPHPDDFTFGIFVQRHARDLSRQGKKVVVAWVFNGVEGVNKTQYQVRQEGLLHEHLVFYPKNSQPSLLGQALRTFDYLHHYSSLIQQVIQVHGKPEHVMVNVAMRAGLLALWLKYTRGIPFSLIEHWSGYLPEDGRYQGKWMKKATERIFREAESVITISQQMRDNMVNRHGLEMKRHFILPNSVDDTIFSYKPEYQNYSDLYFYHISNFVREKQVPELVAVFEQCWSEGLAHRLILSGDGPEAELVRKKFAHRIESGQLVFTGRLTPEQVAEYMQKAVALVLFSLFEGLPCVMLEAWCTGLPVIATAVGGIPEVLSPELGVLLSSGDAQGLYEVIQKISKQAISFNRLLIHELAVGQYASSAVGQQLVRILESINAPHP